MSKGVLVGDSVRLSNSAPLVVIGGINVIESQEQTLDAAEQFVQVCQEIGLPLIFKASFDKANRSSIESYRGPGLEAGLTTLAAVKKQFHIPVITDVHEPWQAEPVAEVVDMLQVPAFLARQTDLLAAIARTGLPVNVKKPQFMSPEQVANIQVKLEELEAGPAIFCERGTQFGYDNLVVDVLGIDVMKQVTDGAPVVVDVTHSLQRRASGERASGGRRQQFMPLARACVATGLAGIFMEAHRNPDLALCDGPSAVPFNRLYSILEQLDQIDKLVKSMPRIEIG
jgi:2-dehydro-3-deoxyphosphooctonate aldolase (KDO 8-P synthase)